ncbi:MAG: methyltransferase domain-containing protein [Patescibacteria group bacterium]|nr:methyltransferase domain-containing protein [Patescibacteria group bacterium]
MTQYSVIFTALLIIFISFLYSVFILDSILTNIHIKYIDVSSSKKATQKVKEILEKLDLKKATFFDLGSGRGAFAIRIKKFFPDFQVYGFDRSPFKIYFSRARSSFVRQKVIFARKNIFDVDLSRADIVYIYTWPETMEKLKNKLEKELRQGAIIIVSTFPVPGWQPQFTQETLMIKKDPGFEKMYVYRR